MHQTTKRNPLYVENLRVNKPETSILQRRCIKLPSLLIQIDGFGCKKLHTCGSSFHGCLIVCFRVFQVHEQTSRC